VQADAVAALAAVGVALAEVARLGVVVAGFGVGGGAGVRRADVVVPSSRLKPVIVETPLTIWAFSIRPMLSEPASRVPSRSLPIQVSLVLPVRLPLL
jgi:hypothetical protein